MRIGQLAKATGVSNDTIRFYEREGLIASRPSTVESNSYRVYPDALTERLAMITEARNAGLSIADIRLLLSHMEGDASDDFDAHLWLRERIADLTQKIADAEKLRGTLQATLDALESASTVEYGSGRFP